MKQFCCTERAYLTYIYTGSLNPDLGGGTSTVC